MTDFLVGMHVNFGPHFPHLENMESLSIHFTGQSKDDIDRLICGGPGICKHYNNI